MDIEKTRAYYKTLTRENVCSCDYCQNFIDEVKSSYPRFAEFLAVYGADAALPFEVMLPPEPVDGYMDYWGVEYLLAGSSEGFKDTKIEDISVNVTDIHPDAAYIGEYFIINAGVFHIRCRYDKYSFE